MDTPESPSQSPQSPEEEERALSDSELLGSVDGDASKAISDSEIVPEENYADEDEAEESGEQASRLAEDGQEKDEMVPDFVSDPEEDEPIRDVEQVDKSIVLMEEEEEEEEGEEVSGINAEEEEKRVTDTPLSPNSEPDREDIQEKVYSEEEDEDNGKPDEESETRRTSVAVREIKNDSPSVSRELDEHELDYDEEVPEEPTVPLPEEEEEEEAKTEGEVETESSKRKEKKPILPPSPTDNRKNEEGRTRRDSFRDKRNDDDDGEIDEGEIDDEDLEEGEVKDPSDRKIRPRPICRFFMKGNCTWGMNCRFIHPGVNDKGNYSLITKPDPFSPNGAPPGGPHPLMPNNPWAGPAVEELPPPPPPVEPPVESAWERGLRHAKEVLKKATMRKEQEPDFEEKRFNVTIGEDEREFDKENDFFRERSYRIIRDEMDFRDPVYGDPYADPYYDYEMEALWRGGQYENFRVQYTEAPLPYHYNDRERDLRERPRDRERERDHRERERRQRERERERERERLRRKDEWERDRMKREDKERPRLRPPREAREKKDEEKLKGQTDLGVQPNRPMEPPLKKDSVPMAMRRPDEWKDPWRRSKSPRRRPNTGSPLRGRRRHRPSGSSVSLSNSSRSSSRSSSYTGSGSSRSRSRSSSFSSYTSHSSQHSSFSGSRSRSRSFSSSPSRSPAPLKNSKNRLVPLQGPKGAPLKAGAMPPPRRDKPPIKKAPSPPPPPGPQGRPPKTSAEPAKPPITPREPPGSGASVGGATAGRPAPPKEPAKPPNPREGRRKERHVPRRRTVSGSASGSGSSYSGSSSRSRSSSNSLSRSGSRKSRSLSVSSVSSVSSASSSSSSVRSADSDDMYADLASPVSSASSHSPSPGRSRKDREGPRDRPLHSRDKARERPSKKEEGLREERRKMDQAGGPPQRGNPVPRSGPGSRGAHPSPGSIGPPASYGGSGSHKDIKLTLLNKQQADKGNRKRYLPSDKDRPGSPASKRMVLSPDRGRDKRTLGRAPPSPRAERLKAPGTRPVGLQGDRKRPMSPPPKSSGKGQGVPSAKVAAPGSVSAASTGSSKPSNTLSRREELLKQLKAVEDAIARKRAKMPTK
ncbi:zinc finger CCCH domain-containing protein 18 [Periophthalmus magnuspinnatus]|uniref:zinc finger CCCH domain-containing protein 18 n=1 Tax=Periophthalmus magnuspinnatus TaxID=409849 RepID=UPI00145A2AA2|nr:zinc finger CCCH domain-containing protein 18 [Periophthalmus magnuspinnatus]XP_033824662.1 zinc finger CCCH domain-containing protein 18 [Periophthalmus magnuspinnatus]XP_033824663.1 zinc finger CCCH domain-containing protein 18 [Periophthalmus magnuspinnatus]